jgi:metal-responsive CopG/Arc/MetJ family transcriptional regulator
MRGTQRAHILIPTDLLREIDAIAGRRGRSAFLLETVREEVRRRKLLRLLESTEPAWQDAHHPELKEGSDAWVRKLRSESESRSAARENTERSRKSKRR